MSEDQQTSEQAAGGLLGKVAGRAKEIVGSALGHSELDREGRLQQFQVDAEQEAIVRGEEAEEKERRGQAGDRQSRDRDGAPRARAGALADERRGADRARAGPGETPGQSRSSGGDPRGECPRAGGRVAPSAWPTPSTRSRADESALASQDRRPPLARARQGAARRGPEGCWREAAGPARRGRRQAARARRPAARRGRGRAPARRREARGRRGPRRQSRRGEEETRRGEKARKAKSQNEKREKSAELDKLEARERSLAAAEDAVRAKREADSLRAATAKAKEARKKVG